MPPTWKKSKLGKQDIFFDDAGTHATTSVEKSDGTNRTVSKLNASHLPILATTRSQKTADDTAFTATDVDAAIKELAAELNLIGIPDGTILQFAAGVLQIAAASITQAKMANESIDSDQYVDGSIDLVHLSNDSVDGSKIVDDSIDSEHYTDDSIDNEHYAPNSVGIVELNMDNLGQTFALFSINAAEVTWGGVSNTRVVTGVTGALTTDRVSANFQDINLNGVSIVQAYVSATDEVTMIASGAGDTNDTISYIVFRPTVAVT